MSCRVAPVQEKLASTCRGRNPPGFSPIVVVTLLFPPVGVVPLEPVPLPALPLAAPKFIPLPVSLSVEPEFVPLPEPLPAVTVLLAAVSSLENVRSIKAKVSPVCWPRLSIDEPLVEATVPDPADPAPEIAPPQMLLAESGTDGAPQPLVSSGPCARILSKSDLSPMDPIARLASAARNLGAAAAAPL